MRNEVVIKFDDLATADLSPGTVLLGGTSGRLGDEPLHHVVAVGNQGGIRYAGRIAQCRAIALFSTFEDPLWPDRLDSGSGVLTYYGDNRTADRALTEPRGNALLHHWFGRGFNLEARRQWPPILLVSHANESGLPPRSQRFHGVAVPGSSTLPPHDWLVAKWFERDTGRFQNYVLTATLLDVELVTRSWLDQLMAGDALGSACPGAYREWVERGEFPIHPKPV